MEKGHLCGVEDRVDAFQQVLVDGQFVDIHGFFLSFNVIEYFSPFLILSDYQQKAYSFVLLRRLPSSHMIITEKKMEENSSKLKREWEG